MSYPSLREATELAYDNGQFLLGWHGVIFRDGENLDGKGNDLGVVWWCRSGRYHIQYWVKVEDIL